MRRYGAASGDSDPFARDGRARRPAQEDRRAVSGFVLESELRAKPIVPLHARPPENPAGPRPRWLLAPAATGRNFRQLKQLVNDLNLHTVCESAACPNIGDCWNRRSATFMILGNVCTRRCGFCAVQKGPPSRVDYDEPARVAEAIGQMGLRHAVITSVNRDDRSDGGAELFAMTILAVRSRLPHCSVEVLVPDFQGSREAMDIVLGARPDILNHNVETVPRLYRTVRIGSDYRRSLGMLRYAKDTRPSMPTKSGIMVGLGETPDEIRATMRDLRDSNVDILTVGQYLRPSADHLAIQRFYAPDEFEALGRYGRRLGFRHVESGALVRSSYHADEGVAALGTEAADSADRRA